MGGLEAAACSLDFEGEMAEYAVPAVDDPAGP